MSITRIFVEDKVYPTGADAFCISGCLPEKEKQRSIAQKGDALSNLY